MRLLLSSLLLIALAACSGPAERRWLVESIDGRDVSSEDYWIMVRRGEIIGGRDGCNSWSWAAEQPSDGDFLIVTDAQECPDDPTRRAYHAIVHSRGKLPLPDAQGRARLARGGHQAVFRRVSRDEPRAPC